MSTNPPHKDAVDYDEEDDEGCDGVGVGVGDHAVDDDDETFTRVNKPTWPICPLT